MAGELTGNTGQADGNSVWGAGLLNTAIGWGTAGADIYNKIAGRSNTSGNNSHAGAASPPATTPAPESFMQKYGLWVMIAGVVIVALFLFKRK